jgi:hypothetical protein
MQRGVQHAVLGARPEMLVWLRGAIARQSYDGRDACLING